MTGALKWYDIRKLRSTLQKIWNDLPQKPCKDCSEVSEAFAVGMNKAGGHFYHFIW